MFFPALFVLFAVAAALDQRDECLQEVWKNCKVENGPEEFPETMEDLKRDCEVIQDMARCIAEGFPKCDPDSFFARHMGVVAQFLETNCVEDSPIYQVVSKNYECIKPIAKTLDDDSQCRPYGEKWIEIEQNLVPKAGELSPIARSCAHPLYELTCNARKFGSQCGQEVQETIFKIMAYMQMNFKQCYEENTLRELQPLKELFESSFNELPEVVNDILDEFKEALDK